jgi:hypothetical protein
MKNSILFFSLLVSVFITQTLKAQQFIQDVSGIPFVATKYSAVEGFPNLFTDWKKAQVKLKDGAQYQDLDLMYDLVKDELSFKSKDGQAMLFKQSVVQFQFNDMEQPYVSGIDGGKFFTDRNYLHQMSTGKITVYKRTVKNIIEKNEYNTVAKTQVFLENIQYFYTLNNGPLSVFKKDKKMLLELLTDKQIEVQTFITKNNIKLKEDKDLISVLAYYNSL